MVLLVSGYIFFTRNKCPGADPGFVVRGEGVSRRGVWGPFKVPSGSKTEPWQGTRGAKPEADLEGGVRGVRPPKIHKANIIQR